MPLCVVLHFVVGTVPPPSLFFTKKKKERERDTHNSITERARIHPGNLARSLTRKKRGIFLVVVVAHLFV